MPISRVHTFANKTIVDGAELDQEFDAIVSAHNAGHTTADISGDAGILLTQLEASYEHLHVNLHVTTAEIGGWPGANTVVCVTPVPGLTGETAWVATSVYWVCADTGAGTGTFDVEWGEFDAAGTWSGTDITSSPITMTNSGGGAGSANDGTTLCPGSGTTLTVAATPRSLALVGVTAEAGTLAGGNNYDYLSVTVNLRRQISAT